MSSFISIGCECGGPEAKVVAERKVVLSRALSKNVTSTHCSAIDEYALVLRVDGCLAQYGLEGPAKVRFAKAKRYITVDLQIPEARWKPLVVQGLEAYLVRQVEVGLRACIARLRKDKYEVNQEALMVEVGRAVTEYLSSTSSTTRRSDA